MNAMNTLQLMTLSLGLLAAHGTMATESLPLAVPATTSAPTPLRLGTLLNLSGRNQAPSRQLLSGLQAAFLEGQGTQPTVLEVRDDEFNPEISRRQAQVLLDGGAVAFVGNFGTPTGRAVLPLLAQSQAAAIGFLSGDQGFTDPAVLGEAASLVVNVRARYEAEVARLVAQFRADGAALQEICAYVNESSFGQSGLLDLRRTLEKAADAEAVARYLAKNVRSAENMADHLGNEPAFDQHLAALNAVIDTPPGDRNLIGPVGFYDHQVARVRDGFESLREWATTSGVSCRAVVVYAGQEAALDFLAYSRSQGKDWGVGLLSNMTQQYLDEKISALAQVGTDTGAVYHTQVVPPLDTAMPLLEQAHRAVGPQLDTLSLEGYMVGRLTLWAAEQTRAKGQPLTGSNLVASVLGQQLEIGGLALDFTDDNQGSDEVWLLRYNPADGFKLVANSFQGWETASASAPINPHAPIGAAPTMTPPLVHGAVISQVRP